MALFVAHNDQSRTLVEDVFEEGGEALPVLPGTEEVAPFLPQFRLHRVVEHDHGGQVQHGGRLVPVDVLT